MSMINGEGCDLFLNVEKGLSASLQGYLELQALSLLSSSYVFNGSEMQCLRVPAHKFQNKELRGQLKYPSFQISRGKPTRFQAWSLVKKFVSHSKMFSQSYRLIMEKKKYFLKAMTS